MKRLVLFVFVATIFLTACNSPEGKPEEKKESKQTVLTKSGLFDKIGQNEKSLFSDKSARINKKSALELVEDYQQFANRFPKDTLAPEYLFKASDISMNLGRPRVTVNIFNRLISDYPDFNKISTCYFLRAFVYDDQLKDYVKAEKYYKDFLERFPDSEFADDAQMLMKNMGKSPEQLIKDFGE